MLHVLYIVLQTSVCKLSRVIIWHRLSCNIAAMLAAVYREHRPNNEKVYAMPTS